MVKALPTPGRLLVSAFIVVYLLANVVVAIPGAPDMARRTGERFSPDDRIARFVRPHLDAVQPPARRLTAAVWTLTEPMRLHLGPLVRRVRLAQGWWMFANPPRTNTLLAVRVDGRLPTGEAVSRAVQILPSGEDTGFRGLSFYRPKYRDKALTNSIDAWDRMRRDHPAWDEQRETGYGRDVFGRIARYFGPRVSAGFPPGTVATRFEVWQGTRPIAPRGFPEETAALPPLTSLPAGAAVGQKVGVGRASWVLRRTGRGAPVMWRLWEDYWFRKIPPHQYALIRIALGFIGLAIMAGLSDIDTFWRLDGLVNPTDSRPQQMAAQLFGLDHAPVVAFSAAVTTYVLMSLGVGSHVTVPLAFVAAVTQLSWNKLPLSGAYQVLLNLLFCLAFAECGGIWSVDAWWRRRRGRIHERPAVIWPLRLLRFQTCLIYFVTGWWKLQNVHWRDGSALQYVLSNTQFRRLPFDPPLWATELLTIGTYLTLFWELLFAFLVLQRTTRKIALAIGVMLHVGMLLTMELGTFPVVMLASYIAFLEPETLPRLASRLRARLGRKVSATSTRP